MTIVTHTTSDTTKSFPSSPVNFTPIENKTTYFTQRGDEFDVNSKEAVIMHDLLPGGNYSVQFNPVRGYYLEKIANFPEQKKVYGNSFANRDRIINTFKIRPNNLGVVLTGEKGSGKTMLGRMICSELAKEGVPTLFINAPLTDGSFFEFLYRIEQPCIVFIDEFEKIYDGKQQLPLLTVLDGVFPSKKLFLLTCNDGFKIDTHFRNRPGRIHYFIEYSGLDANFVKEYCEDNLNNKNHINQVVEIAGIFQTINFDTLKSLVWEMNAYNENPADALRLLNARPSREPVKYFFEIEFPLLNTILVADTPENKQKYKKDKGVTLADMPTRGQFDVNPASILGKRDILADVCVSNFTPDLLIKLEESGILVTPLNEALSNLRAYTQKKLNGKLENQTLLRKRDRDENSGDDGPYLLAEDFSDVTSQEITIDQKEVLNFINSEDINSENETGSFNLADSIKSIRSYRDDSIENPNYYITLRFDIFPENLASSDVIAGIYVFKNTKSGFTVKFTKKQTETYSWHGAFSRFADF